MKRVFIATLGLLLLPSLVYAASFAKQSLFLSKSSVTEGDAVLIHTVVSNEAASKFSGELTVSEGDTKIGSVSVSLATQEAKALSLSWTPSAGSHTIVAKLVGTDGAVAEQQSATFYIQEKPKPQTQSNSATDSTDIASSLDIQNSLAAISPQAASLSEPIFSSLDSLRIKAIGAIDDGVLWAKKQTTQKPTGSVLSADSGNSSSGFVGTISMILATILLYVFSILRYLIANPALFYPIFAIAFLWGLWKLYKRMRRPKFE